MCCAVFSSPHTNDFFSSFDPTMRTALPPLAALVLPLAGTSAAFAVPPPSWAAAAKAKAKASGTPTALRASSSPTAGAEGGNPFHRGRAGPRIPVNLESAILVEWEPITELQRRIDEGLHYEHCEEDGWYGGGGDELSATARTSGDDARRQRRRGGGARGGSERVRGRSHGGGGGGGGGGKFHAAGRTISKNSDGEEKEEDAEDVERVMAVFAGFSATQQEMERLRSADPGEQDRYWHYVI